MTDPKPIHDRLPSAPPSVISSRTELTPDQIRFVTWGLTVTCIIAFATIGVSFVIFVIWLSLKLLG